MRVDIYHHWLDEPGTLARLEELIIDLTERTEKMTYDLITEVQQTRDAVTGLSIAVTDAVSVIGTLVATVADLKAQLEAGGLTAEQEAAAAAELDGVQADLGTLRDNLVASIPAPPEPVP